MGFFDFFEGNSVDLREAPGTKLKMKDGKELLLIDSLIYPLCITRTNGKIVYSATEKFNEFYPTHHERVSRLKTCIENSLDLYDLLNNKLVGFI
ncbi:MAG: hypothetical protein KKD07_09625 [Candidatus Omnitrophica bacterium]|nr:hypothetical protein [Candidatus Omnitrophota bacterium]